MEQSQDHNSFDAPIRTKSTFSLPRIIQPNEQQSPSPKKHKKLLKNYHKAKWSLAPNCLLEGHQGKQILYVCINPECTQSTRFACEQCFFKNHSKHNQQFLAIDEIKNASIEQLRFWPFDKKYRKLFQFVTKHDSYISNMVQDVNATFNSMAMKILASIDKIRLKLLKKIDTFYLKQSTKQQYCNKVKKGLQTCFELKKIKKTVQQSFSKQIRHDVFLKKMNKILKDQTIEKERQSLLKYFYETDKGNDMVFDKMHFLKKQNWIIQQIQEQQTTLKKSQVTIDEAAVGIEKIIPQTMSYLDKNAQQFYPLTFDKVKVQDGSQYVGFLSKGTRVVIGMRKYNSGYIYYGQWKINARNGWGVYENKAQGYRYEGYWRQDKKSGFGKQTTVKYSYEGNFLSDRRDGFGVLIQDGVRYQINWKADKKHGQGKKIQGNGIQKQIYFLNGIQSTMKSNKSSPAFDIKALSKRFTNTTHVPGKQGDRQKV